MRPAPSAAGSRRSEMKPLLAAIAGIVFGYLALKGAVGHPVEIVTLASAPLPVPPPRSLVLHAPALAIEDDVLRIVARDQEDGSLHAVVLDRASFAVQSRAPTTEPPSAVCRRGQTCDDLRPLLRRLAVKPDDAALLAVANGRLLRIAPGPNGAFRLAARDLATKAKLYDEEVPGLGYGTKVSALYADRDEVFLVANGALLAIDARTGRLTARLDSL